MHGATGFAGESLLRAFGPPGLKRLISTSSISAFSAHPLLLGLRPKPLVHSCFQCFRQPPYILYASNKQSSHAHFQGKGNVHVVAVAYA